MKSFLKIEKRENSSIIIFDAFFTLCFCVGRKIVFSGIIYGNNKQNYFLPFSLVDLLAAAGVFAAVYSLLRFLFWLDEKKLHDFSEKASPKRYMFFVFFVLLALAWLPYLLTFSPGNVYADSLSSINQGGFGTKLYSDHPVFYTMFVGAFVKTGLLFNSVNKGVFLYTLVQTGLMLTTVSALVYKLYKNGVHILFLIFTMGYYMFVPYFPAYSIAMLKDPLYSCALLWLIMLLSDVVLLKDDISSKGFVIKFVLVSAAVLLFRNNGILTIVLLTIALLAVFRSKAKKLCLSLLCLIAAYALMTCVVFKLCGITSNYSEKIGMPLLQIGAVVVEDGNMTKEQEQFVYSLMTKENWERWYAPCIADAIKWDPSFNNEFLEQNKTELIKVWLQMFPKNVSLYLKEYCMETFGLWKGGVQCDYGYYDLQIAGNPFGIEGRDLFNEIFGFSIYEMLCANKPFVGSGTLAWVTLLFMLFAKKRKSLGGLCYLPAVLNWATMFLGTPVAFSLRYVYIFALALPLIVLFPWLPTRELKND